ncbi:MAG TPA: MobA/MobL family protein, partial [Sphingomicrobium sp.]
MSAHAWSINGSAASAHDLREAQALERQSRKKRSAIEYERQQQEGNARAVGAGIRKQMRQVGWRKVWVNVRPKIRSGRAGVRRCARFEVMTRQVFARPSRVGGDGLSSFHFKWTGRGLAAQRGQGSHRFRAGEARRHVQYILRELAREIADGGLVSNISQDPEVIAALFSAIEELEGQGRINANVYVSLVISMPHELTGAQREDLLTRICAIFARDDLPHVGILHAPDSRGDQRNNHAHVMLSLRPFRIEGDGSFALASGTCADLNDKGNIKAMRTEVADLMNEAMIAAGRSRRFTARSNKDRRLTPLTKRDGKSTPGIKHHERREARIEQLREDEACHKERRAALARLRGELTAALSAPVVDRQAIIERVSKR